MRSSSGAFGRFFFPSLGFAFLQAQESLGIAGQVPAAPDKVQVRAPRCARIGPEEINGFRAGWKRSGLGGDDGEQGYRTYVRTKVTYLDYNE